MPSTDFGRLGAPRRWLAICGVVLLLLIHFALAVGSKREASTTADEIAHVTAGVAYWEHHDYRLQPENGILPQRWAALPAYLAGATFPTLTGEDWRTGDVWVLGHRFFYETGEDHFPRLMAARAMIALFSVATGCLVFGWARRWFGTVPAFCSLGLFAFSPLFLAHGALATSDACMGFFFLASVSAYWRHLHDGRISWALLSAATFGFACVAKFSAVLLLPMLGVMALVRVLAPQPLAFGGREHASRTGKVGAILVSALLHAVVAWLVIWSFYGFRYSATNPALPPATGFYRPWPELLANIGFQGEVVRLLAKLHALPEAFLYGYTFVIDAARERAAFLHGEVRFSGWASYFPWTFLLKTTLPVLLGTIVGAGLLARRWTRGVTQVGPDLYRALPLVVLFVIYWAVSLGSHINIGHRHILPTYPVLFILLGGLATAGGKGGWRWFGLALVGWQGIEAIRSAPYYLAYFNPIAGGPRQAYRQLVDSSLDWGQDLPGLKRWLDAQAGKAPVYLSYFGTGEPAYYGIRARRLEMVNGFHLFEPFVRLEPGVYCISATMLQHVYSPVRGPWTIEYEKAYQKLRALEPAWVDYDRDPAQRAFLEKEFPDAQWERKRDDYEALRFARLCHYLRERQPDAQVGYSINIYRLSAEELRDVTEGDLGSWRRAIERAIEARAGK